MGQAYTPGLEVTAKTTLERVRELPLPGKVLVKVGDVVDPDTPVLRAELPGEIEIVRIADRLGLDPEDVRSGLRVSVGQRVERGDLLCEVKGFFGLFVSRLTCPASGTIEYFTEGNAHLGIRGPSQPLEVSAYVHGTVAEVVEEKSVTVRTTGALIQGIFGVGGERQGTIRCLDLSPDAEVNATVIESAANLGGAILIGGAAINAEGLRAAAAAGVRAVVTGSIDSHTLREYVGYEIGVSITGDEDVPATLIVTEGFGRLPISSRVVELGRSLEGRSASVNGATQVRAGAMRPEVIVPADQAAAARAERSEPPVLRVGSRVRIIRLPHFGAFARVTELPSKPERIPSGAIVRVLRAELEGAEGGGETVTVPRANVELV